MHNGFCSQRIPHWRTTKRQKLTMLKKAKNVTKNVTASAATFNAPKGTVVTGAMLNAWVNQHAGGQWANVQFVPNTNANVANKYTTQGGAKPLPFGYGGKPTGIRAIYQNYYLYGMQTKQGLTKNLALIHSAMRKTDGHSLQQLICLCAMFNGGYGKKATGIAYGTLVATKPTA